MFPPVEIMDCTLRDGANVVGNGFSPELTRMMIEGLLRSNIRIIEMGNAKGLGATEKGSPAPMEGLPRTFFSRSFVPSRGAAFFASLPYSSK